jgi:hypothetical protein
MIIDHVIKVGTIDVVINANNEGPTNFGESTKGKEVSMGSNNKVDNKVLDPKYSMPRWCPSGLTRSQKRKLQRLRAKENKEKEVERVFNKTHLEYLWKQWKPKDAKAQAQAVILNKAPTM